MQLNINNVSTDHQTTVIISLNKKTIIIYFSGANNLNDICMTNQGEREDNNNIIILPITMSTDNVFV